MSALSSRLRQVLTEHAAQPAVEGTSGSLSYAQLEARSAKIADRLAAAGVGPGNFVPILLSRSVEFVLAAVAVVRCGGAYVPIDTTSPAARQAAILEQFDWSVALVAGERPAGLDTGACLDVAEVCAESGCCVVCASETGLWAEREDDSPLYLMFTSGSTGTPKGVLIPDRGVARLVIEPDYVDLSPKDRWALASSVAFDAATLEIWAPLLNGGTCVVQEKALPSLAEFGSFFANARITHGWLTAGLFNLLVAENAACLAGFRQLLVGGERESPEHIRRFLEACPGVTLIHGYGPTENTTFSLCHHIETVDNTPEARVPIGRPIRGSTAMLVDPEDRPILGPGEGELLVGGEGVALGYFNDDELTARRFIERDGSRWYRTGDLVQRDEAGVYIFLGRADRQVKIQGNRIELDEVEKTLAGLPGIGEAIVEVAGEAAEERHLIGWYTGQNGSTPTPEAVLSMLAERLPRIMVPHRLHLVDSMPRMISGKIDRQALQLGGWKAPAPVGKASAPDGMISGKSDRQAPAAGVQGRDGGGGELSTETQRRLAVIWQELLGCDRLDAHSRYAEQGGTSLLSLRVAAEIERRCGRKVSPIEVLEHQTLGDLARCIDHAPTASDHSPKLVKGDASEITPTRMQQQMLIGSAIDPSGSAYLVHLAIVMPAALSRETIRAVIERLVQRHPALRTCATVRGDEVRLHRADGPDPDWWTEHEAEVVLDEDTRRVPESLLPVLSRRFALDGSGLVRAEAWPIRDGGGRLVVLTVHHAIMDDHSLRLCLEDILADCTPGRQPEQRPESPIDFAAYEAQRLDRDEIVRCADRLATVLEGHSPPLACGPAPGGELPVDLDPDTHSTLHCLAQHYRCTPFPILLAAYGAAIQRVFGESWRFVLTPFSRRGAAELAGEVGCLLDLRLLEAGARPGESRAETIHRLCGEVSDAMRPAFVPFGDLVEAIRAHDPALADAPRQFVFTWRTECLDEFAIEGADGVGGVGRVLEVPQTGARFGMVLHLCESEQGLDAKLEATQAVLEGDQAQEVAAHFVRVLREWGRVAEREADQIQIPRVTLSLPSEKAVASCDHDGVVSRLWAEVIGAAPARPETDFLRAGGSSLLALKLAAMLHRECGVEIDLAEFLSDPRYASLCRAVWCAQLRETHACGLVGSGAEEEIILIIPGAMGRSVGMVGLATAIRNRSGGSRGVVISDLEEIMAGVPRPPRGKEFVEHLVTTCEQIGFDRLAGIVGYSIGGLLGIEVAARAARVHGVDIPVCLLDTYAPSVLRRDIWSRASRKLISLARHPLGVPGKSQPQTAGVQKHGSENRATAATVTTTEAHNTEVLSVRERVEQDPGWRILFADMARQPVPAAGVRASLIRSLSTAAAVGVFRWPRSNGFDPGAFASLRIANLVIDHLELVKSGAADVAEAMDDLAWIERARQ